MKRYPYALPDRVAIFGSTYGAVINYMANDLDVLDVMGLEIVRVSASAHPGAVVGMRLVKVIEVPGVRDHDHYTITRELLDDALAAHENGA